MRNWALTVYISFFIAISSALALSYVLKLKNESLMIQLNSANAETAALNLLAQKSREMSNVRDDIDKKMAEKLSDALAKVEDLAGAIDSKSIRLRVNAKCPAVLPTGSESSGRANAEKPELDEGSRLNYINFRRLIEVKENQIEGLQEYIERICINNGSQQKKGALSKEAKAK